METSRARILYFIDNQGINSQDFLRKTGLKKGFVDKSHIKSSASDIYLSKILDKYPDLSAEWLLTGRGEMLKQEQPKQEIANIDYKERYYKSLEKNTELHERIDALQQKLLNNTSNMEDNMNRSVG
ncbi:MULTISPECIES: hypothetical protein [Tenacibaculum]|uniref:HTH cro/C1-type domain-containing protein n=1 Tax=Tenacibaculum dicentrarchi TaxID=669041 RepID=A0ABM9NU66_9FLAO|nr:hypothetical protein [Tenacibaculum finnmarkense]SOS54283.1 hypothetical protein TD3509T_600148 [Tenacibaculum dicentrarchi]MBE7649236.1 hypothetical protein [Tenacibaculum finnmarkense genomovar ulcerans]MCD8410735.1 hypothetical protein [Tenacibaculum finnmarkense genomovar ulcerans]MCG8868204.1 hypothetical protein [Tenacibaculum finnmarkense]MCG8878564.1 hypothetical protein [Tenacibaculum finnmarkense]